MKKIKFAFLLLLVCKIGESKPAFALINYGSVPHKDRCYWALGYFYDTDFPDIHPAPSIYYFGNCGRVLLENLYNILSTRI